MLLATFGNLQQVSPSRDSSPYLTLLGLHAFVNGGAVGVAADSYATLIEQILHMLAVILPWLTMTSIPLHHHGLLGLAVRDLALIRIFASPSAGAMPSQGYRSCLYTSPLIRVVDFSVGVPLKQRERSLRIRQLFVRSILLRSPSTSFCMHPQFQLQVESDSAPLILKERSVTK